MTRVILRLGLGLGFGLVLVGCSSTASHQQVDGGGVGNPANDAGSDTSSNGFMLTSTAFAQGGAIPAANTCNDPNKINASPELAWTGAPSGTKSFALILTDQSLAPPLLHWVIFDIAANATDLPAHVENVFAPANVSGAHQTLSQAKGQPRGYAGPCPPATHNYEFKLYALDIATLPGGGAQTTPQEALVAIVAHQVATATLKGTYMP